MPEYRIVFKKGRYHIQQKCLWFFWFNVHVCNSTTAWAVSSATFEGAEKRVAEFQEYDTLMKTKKEIMKVFK